MVQDPDRLYVVQNSHSTDERREAREQEIRDIFGEEMLQDPAGLYTMTRSRSHLLRKHDWNMAQRRAAARQADNEDTASTLSTVSTLL